MLESDRLIAATSTPEEWNSENSIRPKSFSEYIGQEPAKKQLNLCITSAKKRKDALDHVLVYGPPGLGKTTIANIIAHEMQVKLKQTSGPVIEKAGDLAALITHLEAGDILFIDEIHRLDPKIEEILYPAMEDRQLDIMIGEGPAARSVKLELPPFTLVGATTRAGLLTSPLRDRFGIVLRLEFYNTQELTQIILRSSKLLSTIIDEAGAEEIANRSRGTPRIANRLLKRARDVAIVEGKNRINQDIAKKALILLDIDEAGLDMMDCKLLSLLIERFQGGPAGLDSLAAALGEDRGTIEDVIEPYLIQKGLLMRTPRGRVVTQATYLHFGLNIPESFLRSNEEIV